ncbi:hypothetical protein SHIRM173S_12907 [Streptomyces hirsutus]
MRPGSTPTTRMPRGPGSSARDLAKPASPGRSPLEMVRPGSGSCTEPDSTKPMTPPSPSSAAAARAIRTAPRNTDSNAACHCSSVVSATNPGGGPPTLTRMPSKRWNRSRAVAISRAAAPGSALSTATPTASGPRSAGRLGDALVLPSGDDHLRAVRHQLARGGVAQPAGRPGDYVHPVLQSKIHGPYPASSLPNRARAVFTRPM